MGLGRGVFTRRRERSTEGRQAEEKRRDTGRKGGHEEEDDGSEASSTVLGYSLPVSWGPRCTRTILFLFLFFATHCFPLFFFYQFRSFFPLLFVPFFLPFLSQLPLVTFLRLRRLYLLLFLFLSLFVFFLVSLTPLQSRVATFSALFSLFRIHRVSTATLQLATSCALVCFLPRHSSLSLSLCPSFPPLSILSLSFPLVSSFSWNLLGILARRASV